MGLTMESDRVGSNRVSRTVFAPVTSWDSTRDDIEDEIMIQWKQTLALSQTYHQDAEIADIVLERSRTHNADNERLSRSETWIPTTAATRSLFTVTGPPQDYFSAKRRFSLQLPSFASLGISKPSKTLSIQDNRTVLLSESDVTDMQADTLSSNSLAVALCGGPAPLTPPPEDHSVLRLDHYRQTPTSGGSVCSRSQPEPSDHQSAPALEIPSLRMQGIALPVAQEMASSSEFQKMPWLAKTLRGMVASLSSSTSCASISMVSQTLPSQAKDSRLRPTFEEVLEILQTELEKSPYITITHAVPQARVMEELPKTPPSTPNMRQEITDYFGNDQTIFTHAAVVPIYHSHDRVERSNAGRLAQYIAAPCSIQAAVLERYIPPTTPQEIDDFFSISTRSYLTDRLSELSVNNGSLLLIYPTRTGGDTFSRQYIGPIIDPHLRRFIMLNGLTSAAAAMMGTMTAVKHMLDFDEMKARVTTLCESLASRASARGPRSAYTISHSEIANVTLDRSTWVNWYIEQEQSRLRQNLVEYHQSGGRMPEAEGIREITVGMLTRDFIEGINKSTEPAGDADIEVGVFLITRSMLQQERTVAQG